MQVACCELLFSELATRNSGAHLAPREARAIRSRQGEGRGEGVTIAAVLFFLISLLGAELRLQDEHLIARVTGMSGDVRASSCRGHLLLAWRDGSGVDGAVDGRRVVVNGATRGTPAAACGTSSWLVVWPTDDFGVDGRRVGFDGGLLDAQPLHIFRGPFGASEVAAAYGSNAFLVMWVDGVTVHAIKVSDAGAVAGAPHDASLSGLFAAPRVVWSGTAFFAVWSEDHSNSLLPQPTHIWGTRVLADGSFDPAIVPMIDAGAGARGMQASLTRWGDRFTVAWVAEHGAQTCVDVAQVSETRALLVPPRHIRCSGDASGDGVPVLDHAEVLANRNELMLVWRELLSDFSSVLRVTRLDETANPKDLPPYALLTRSSSAAWAPGLAPSAAGATAAYFAALPPPEEATVGVFTRVIEQDKPPPRRRAVGR